MKGDLLSRVLAEAGKLARSRSSVLIPLQWAALILLASMLLLVFAKAPAWMQIGVFALAAAVVLLLCIAFVYFMTRNPDALRSEKHVLSKYAIDKGLYGDSDTGMLEVPKVGNDFLLPDETEHLLLENPRKGIRRESQ